MICVWFVDFLSDSVSQGVAHTFLPVLMAGDTLNIYRAFEIYRWPRITLLDVCTQPCWMHFVQYRKNVFFFFLHTSLESVDRPSNGPLFSLINQPFGGTSIYGNPHIGLAPKNDFLTEESHKKTTNVWPSRCGRLCFTISWRKQSHRRRSCRVLMLAGPRMVWSIDLCLFKG